MNTNRFVAIDAFPPDVGKNEMKPLLLNTRDKDEACRNYFPSKLFRMLEVLDDESLNNIACWQPHGKAFRVIDTKMFETLALPRFFRHTKLSSFQRQLNIYNFQRISNGPDQNSYYHQCFVRDRPELLSRIHRQATKGHGVRRTESIGDPPNFYDVVPQTTAQRSNTSSSASIPGSTQINGNLMVQQASQNQHGLQDTQMLQILLNNSNVILPTLGGDPACFNIRQRQQLQQQQQQLLDSSLASTVPTINMFNNSLPLGGFGPTVTNSHPHHQQLLPSGIDYLGQFGSLPSLSAYQNSENQGLIAPNRSNLDLQRLLQCLNSHSISTMNENGTFPTHNPCQHQLAFGNGVNLANLGHDLEQFWNPGHNASFPEDSNNEGTRTLLEFLIQRSSGNQQITTPNTAAVDVNVDGLLHQNSTNANGTAPSN